MRSIHLLVGTLLAIFAGWASTALAQQAPGTTTGQNQAANSTLEEIVVTAEKRSENIQEVPITITAFTQSDLSTKGVTDLHGLSALTPNVNLDAGSPFSGSNSVLAASIRGIGQDDFAMNLDPGVGVYVDGVYYARTVGANQNLLDVERIEILNGPQGTLFGRNTIGGAISIVTRTPGEQLALQTEITGGSYDRRDISVMADIPITSNLLSSVTFSSQYRKGYEERIPYHSPTPYVTDPVGAFHSADGNTEAFDTQGGQNEQVARGKLVWTPFEGLKATLSLDWTHTNQPSTASTVLETVTSGPLAVFGAIYNACLVGAPFAPTAALVCGPRNTVGTPLWQANLNPATTRLLYGDPITMTGNIDKTYASGLNFDKLDSYGGALTLDWKLDSAFTLRSITGWRAMHWATGLDTDGSPINFFEVSFAEGQHQVSEEVQLIGDLMDSKLKLVAGLYYFNESGYIHDLVTFGAGLLQIDGPNTLTTSSYAGYVHADYRLTQKLGLTVGARESTDRKSFIGGQTELNEFFYKISGCYPPGASAALIGAPATLNCREALGFTNPDNPTQMYPIGTFHQNFNEFTPTAGIQYHFDDATMAYFSYSKGFKTGGWTTRLTQPLPPGSPAQDFGPETDQSYELGLKSEWFGRRLLVNADVFYSKYDQIQLNYEVLTSPVTQNAGNALIKGAELTTQALLGNHLSLTTNVGYMDAYYTEINAGAQATTGPILPKTPRWKIAVGPDVHTTLSNGGSVRLGVNYTYTSEIFNDVQNTQLLRRPSVNMVDASAGYTFPDGRTTVQIGGVNLTDKRYITTGQPQFAGGDIYGTYNPPREWYATLKLKF